MFKTLLIPIDEFSLKEANLRKIRVLVKKAQASVVLVHVSNPTPPSVYKPNGHGTTYISLSDHLKACEAHSEQLFHRFSKALGRHAAPKRLHLYHSDASAGILEAAKKVRADLILMASHHYPPVFGITSASDIYRVTASATYPVLVC